MRASDGRDDRAPGRGRRRTIAGAMVGALLLAQLLLGVAAPAGACACGAFLDPADRRTGANVLEETAVLALSGGTQTVVMGLQLDATRTGSTLLMPTPTVPEVSAAESGTLREMQAATAPREEVELDLWGTNPFGRAGDGTAGAAPTGAPEVTVHEQSRVGDYEVAVLGGEADGVRDWLAENGYDLPQPVSELLDPYAEEGWTFTAVRYVEDAELSGDLEPLRFDFASDELIYPESFTSDIVVVVEDPEAERVVPTETVTRTVEVAGIPVGWLLVALALVALLAVAVSTVTVVLARRRRV